MTFEAFKVRALEALVDAYGTRLDDGEFGPTFVNDTERTPPLWYVHFVIDEEPHRAAFAYGPPDDHEEARFVTWLAELHSM